ncbi:hypothetical protein PILCRDRAFT_810392 [Piloderma croceum F 1598]|uniref:Dynamin N-terminal domain-containing protein n=1 Tax=Piloderma croceum (strain F 1598) TaxID=765440 RepID=A0A0C3C0H9_PILCF|nr:hypothetical protein PILCRDRAFT_810392 [Piloderma croceum F 1598]
MAEAILSRLLPSHVVLESTMKMPIQKAASYSKEVYTIVNMAMGQLEELLNGASLRHGSQEWPKEAKRLRNLTPSSRTIAIVGGTGAGKSTGMNAVCRCLLLASSSVVLHVDNAFRACTSVITKIQYSETSHFRARVHFITRDAFQAKLKLLLEDVVPSDVGEGIDRNQTDKSPADHSKATLFQLISLRGSTLLDLNVEQLLEDSVVAPFLSNPLPHEIVAQDTTQLREKLRPFVTSNIDHPDEPALWRLVDTVELFGDISALSTGITIIDLPGYGDADSSRNNIAEEYVKTADCIILVADLKRARDDIHIHKYFTKILKQLLVDGRAVDDGSLTLVLTGADHASGDHEVTLYGDNKVTVNEFMKIAQNLEESLKNLKDAYTRVCAYLENGHDGVEIRNGIERMAYEINDQEKKLNTVISSKDITVANQNAEPSPLPIFSVGSRDFLALTRLESGRPAVFNNVEQTGIPQLVQYIRDIVLVLKKMTG